MRLRATPAAAALCLSLCCSVASSPAQATLTASAYQNTIGNSQDSNDALEAVASFGQATARATRSQVHASAIGAGSTQVTHFGASAGSVSHYSLWDMAANLPVSPVDAQQMELAFNFDLVGSVVVGTTIISAASTRFEAGLQHTGGGSQFSDTVSVSFANIFPFPAVGYTIAGNGSLFGSYAMSFSVRHQGAVDGVISFIVANTAGNNATASSTMTLSSVNLLRGAQGAGDLGVRLAETGLIIPVSPVPEPATWALCLAGGCWVVRRARRRAGGAQPGRAPSGAPQGDQNKPR
jgi:hypothetical protein